MKQPASAEERVKIWNSYLLMARQEVLQLLGKTPSYVAGLDVPKADGEPLAKTEHHTMAALLLCGLAIEARANHLIRELQERGKVPEDTANAALWLRPEHKWFLLPVLAGSGRTISAATGPHQAVKEVLCCRNEIVHVKYGELAEVLRNLPPPCKVRRIWHALLRAVDDMNSIVRGKPLATVTFDYWKIDVPSQTA